MQKSIQNSLAAAGITTTVIAAAAFGYAVNKNGQELRALPEAPSSVQVKCGSLVDNYWVRIEHNGKIMKAHCGSRPDVVTAKMPAYLGPSA